MTSVQMMIDRLLDQSREVKVNKISGEINQENTHTHTHITRDVMDIIRDCLFFVYGRCFEINRLHPPFNTFFYDPPKIFVKKALPDNLLLLVFVFRHVLI